MWLFIFKNQNLFDFQKFSLKHMPSFHRVDLNFISTQKLNIKRKLVTFICQSENNSFLIVPFKELTYFPSMRVRDFTIYGYHFCYKHK